MVAPVSGPYTFSRTRSANQPSHTNVLVGSTSRQWYRQVKPYNLSLSFNYSDRQVLSWSVSRPRPDIYAATWDRLDVYRCATSVSSDAQNKALSDFRDQISKGAGWGVTLAQRKQAMSMMTTRVVQFSTFVRHMSKFRFQDALESLGVRDPAAYEKVRWRRLKKRSGSLGDNILEFRFGWQPLWNDIHSTVEILGSDIPTRRVVGKGFSQFGLTASADDPYDYYGRVRRTNADTAKCFAKVWADVVMVNPNTALLNNLGLANPFLVLYDIVPWSFVLNYFISLEEFLRNFNTYAGYSLSNQGYTNHQVIKRVVTQREEKYGSLTGNSATFHTQSVYTARTVGSLPSYQLRVRDPWDLKPGRALNALGILLQQLGKR